MAKSSSPTSPRTEAERHDRASAGGLQLRHGVLTHEEHAAEVRGEHGVPGFLGARVDRRVAERSAADPVGGEDGVEPVERREHGFDLVGLSQVGLLAVDPDDVKVLLLEGAPRSSADRAAGSGDERGFHRELRPRRASRPR